MGIYLRTGKGKNDNVYKGEYIFLNNSRYNYGHLLLNFIYNDYCVLLNNIYSELNNLEQNTEISLTLIDSFFNKIIYTNDFISNDTINTDPYLFLLKYEFYIIYCGLGNIIDKDYINTLFKVKKALDGFKNLQDLYYEAINICFNNDHESLNKYSVDEGLNIYYNFNYGINVIKNLSNNASGLEKYVFTENLNELNKNVFDLSEDFQDDNMELLSPSTDVVGRKIITFYDKKNKKLMKNYMKNYNFYEPELNSRISLYKIIEFNSVLSLCHFEFNKLIEYRENFSIKECKLCQKLFISTDSKKIYCNNLFPHYNKPCSDKSVGKKIFKEIKLSEDTTEQKYSSINNKLNMRSHSSPNNKDAYKAFKKIRKLYKSEEISSTNFNELMDYFDNLTSNYFNKDKFDSWCIENNIKCNF